MNTIKALGIYGSRLGIIVVSYNQAQLTNNIGDKIMKGNNKEYNTRKLDRGDELDNMTRSRRA
ncbi:MAG: hypothetical protein ACFFER_09735 [Candidatus Thorarchaeota archaeon]